MTEEDFEPYHDFGILNEQLGATPMIKADPNWWKHLFDDVYLITDGRSVRDEGITSREIDMVQSLLDLSEEKSIVDLCGGEGRHAVHLFRRGFRNVTVVDYSGFLVQAGMERARSENLGIRFIRSDARCVGIQNESFDAALVMANSFGYFQDQSDDSKVLRETHRLLVSGGKLLLDIVDAEYVKNQFQPLSWHEIGQEIVVCRGRQLDGDLVFSREMVISKKSGLIRDQSYCVRLYSAQRISDLLLDVGFARVEVHRGFSPHGTPGEYGFLTNRTIVVAQK